MKKFRFPLDRLRGLRQIRFEQEQARLQAVLEEGRVIEDQLLRLDTEERNAVTRLRTLQVVPVEDLLAVEHFRRWAAEERPRLQRQLAEWGERLAAQRRRLMEARRDVESLDLLREKRLDAWRKEVDKESEAVVGELVLARWQPSKVD